jgi:hypothetical protein
MKVVLVDYPVNLRRDWQNKLTEGWADRGQTTKRGRRDLEISDRDKVTGGKIDVSYGYSPVRP